MRTEVLFPLQSKISFKNSLLNHKLGVYMKAKGITGKSFK